MTLLYARKARMPNVIISTSASITEYTCSVIDVPLRGVRLHVCTCVCACEAGPPRCCTACRGAAFTRLVARAPTPDNYR